MAYKQTNNSKKNKIFNDTPMEKYLNEDRNNNTRKQESQGTRKKVKPAKKFNRRNKVGTVLCRPSGSRLTNNLGYSNSSSLPLPNPYISAMTTYYNQHYSHPILVDPMLPGFRVPSPIILPVQPLPVIVSPALNPLCSYACAMLPSPIIASVVPPPVVAELPAITYRCQPITYTDQINVTYDTINCPDHANNKCETPVYANQIINVYKEPSNYYLSQSTDVYELPENSDSVSLIYSTTETYESSAPYINSITEDNYEGPVSYTNQPGDPYLSSVNYSTPNDSTYEPSFSHTNDAVEAYDPSNSYLTTDIHEAITQIYTNDINESEMQIDEHENEWYVQQKDLEIQATVDTYSTENTNAALEVSEVIENRVKQNQMNDPVAIYLSLPKDIFPAPRKLPIDPNPIIDEFCKLNDVYQHAVWLLDLEYGIPRKEFIRRPLPIYNVSYSSIHCRNSPQAVHPDFDCCDEDFKEVLLFYYDCMVSSLYTGYVRYCLDVSVDNFQSWLLMPMQDLGMCWL